MAKVNPMQVQKYLSGVNYPCSRDDIVSHARSEGADDDIISTLERLPSGKFDTPADISQAIGKIE